MVGRPGQGGLRREFTAEQAALARVLKILHGKGGKLSQLARAANLRFDGEAFIVYDGHDLRVCSDAAAAIATVVKASSPVGRLICPRYARRPQNRAIISKAITVTSLLRITNERAVRPTCSEPNS
jgi:hypothetical protein